MTDKKFVVTGIGGISPLGYKPEDFWNNIYEGNKGLSDIQRFDTSKYQAKTAGELLDFNILDYTPISKYRRLPRISQYALAAALQAVTDSKFKINRSNGSRVGLFFGTCNGPSDSTEKIYTSLVDNGPKSVEPLLFQETVFNAPLSHISINLKITGPCVALPVGIASGGYAVKMALDYLRAGMIDVALVGAADEHTEIVHDALESLHVLSPGEGEEECSRPFDKNRNGLVLSEGGAFLVIEELEDAKTREANIYGEIAGAALASDAYKIADNNPDGEGVFLSMSKLLEECNQHASSIDGIISLAASMPIFDLLEANGIRRVFQRDTKQVPVTSIKGVLGETTGPSALFNIIAALLALRHNALPPTINYSSPDPKIDLNIVADKPLIKELHNISMRRPYAHLGDPDHYVNNLLECLACHWH